MAKQSIGLGLLTGAAGTAIGGALGLGIDAISQKMQLNQAEKLQEMQMQGQKEMAQFNAELGTKTALDMWNKTNYGAQRKHMEAAGLNVGLMYGGGGGGGATTQTANVGGNVQGQSANPGGAAGMGMAIGQQILMNQAQIDLIKAQTEKTKVDTEKTAGVDTQGVILDNEYKKIQNKIKDATTIDEINQAAHNANSTYLDVSLKALQHHTTKESQDAQIQIIKNDAILKSVEIKQKQAGIELTEMQTKETAEKINKIVTEIQSMNIKNEQEWEKILLQRMQTEFNTSEPARIKQWTDIGTDILKSFKGGNSKTIQNNTY